MEQIEVLMRAKTYIDKLANGINPLNDEPVEEHELINNVRLSRCFFYVSDVLRQVIEKGKSTKATKNAGRLAFDISNEELKNFEYSDKPISITHIVKRINKLINQNDMRGLSYITVTKWLREIGMLEDAVGRYGNAKICPSKKGEEAGISIERRISDNGEYYAIYYNRSAQEFIVENIPRLVNN